MPRPPRFCFVATSRNDDHGGDVLRRTQSFVDRLAEQCGRHQVPCELVLVDWNPPGARAPLAEVLGWPAGSPWFTARVITVPPALHRRLNYAKRLAMFQMIAKNVGIRRALGDYVIATNIDIIFSDELFRWLKSGPIREGALYRSDRWDIPNEIQLEPDLDILLARAREQAIRRNLKDGTHIRRDGGFHNISGQRFDGIFYQPLEGLIAGLKQSLGNDGPVPRDQVLLALDAMLSSELPRLRRDFLIPMLHTNACGDFTMMARRDWFALRGYPEWNIFSWHIDSVIVYQAHYNGLPIEELDPAAIHYHIEHDYGSGWTPEGAGSLWARLSERGIPFISYRRFKELVFEMQDNAEQNRWTLYNDPDWGFAGCELECRIVAEEGRPPPPPAQVNKTPLDEDFLTRLVPATPSLRLEAIAAVDDEVRVERGIGDSGEVEILAETRRQMWSYALAFDLTRLPERNGEYWIRLAMTVDSGNVELGVLNADGSDFLMRTDCPAAGREAQPVFAHIEDIGDASRLILRNATPGDQPARFRLTGIQLLREGPDGAANGTAAVSPTPGDAPTPGDDNPAAASGSVALRLGDIRPGTRHAIVSILRGAPTGAAAADTNCQAMIILPAQPEETRAVLDLSGASPAVRRVAVHLHVLEGEAAIGLQASTTGELLTERRERPGAPLTRVDLEPAAASAIGALVIRNASPALRTTLLLHRVEYTAGAPQ
jgi:hypothetical protein